MIPYDELVVALTAWRARQGLPVAQLSGALTPPAPPERPTIPVAPRTTPPSAPPGRPTPPPLAQADTHDEHLEIDEAALLDEGQYDKDFSYAFDNLQGEGESTAIGVAAPSRPSEETLADDAPITLKPKKGKGRGGRNEW